MTTSSVPLQLTHPKLVLPIAVGGFVAGLLDMTSAYLTFGRMMPLGIAGGLIGAVLLLLSGNAVFFYFVPWLLAFATALFTFAKPLVRRMRRAAHSHRE